MQAMSKIVRLVTSEVDPSWDNEFGRWCDEERLPGPGEIPGCLGARRYVALDGLPRYLELAELRSVDLAPRLEPAADSPRASRLRPHVQNQAVVYQQTYPIEGPFHGAAWGDGATELKAILVIRLDIASDHDEEFEEWYSQEHLPALCGVPGVIGGRIFKAVAGTPKHMTIFYLAEPEAQASEAWQRAASTPWTMRMRRLVPNRWRVVYQPLD